jgi:hypothetical protein
MTLALKKTEAPSGAKCKGVLQHLGIRPGEKIELDKLPDGRILLRAARPSGKIDSFIGVLAGKTKKVATLDEINEAAASGWAAQVRSRESGVRIRKPHARR